MARLKILSNDDLGKLYVIPDLNDEEREFIFELDEVDKDYLNTVSSIPIKINYILHLGYFRISRYFFAFTFQRVKKDVKFILRKYLPESQFPMNSISNRQYYANRDAILNKYEMSLYSKRFESTLMAHLAFLAKQHSIPKYLFDSCLDFCNKNNIIRPSYTILQELISNALADEKNRINNKLYRILNASLRKDLDNLLIKNDLFYQLTLIKKDQQDFTTNEIRSSVEKHKLLEAIYKHSITIIKELGISEQNVTYYSDLAIQHTPHVLNNIKMSNLARLYILCYVHSRFLKINDHLIASFIHRANCYVNDADIYQKEAIYQCQIIDIENRDLAANILSLNTNSKIPDAELRDKAFEMVSKEQYEDFVQKIRKPHSHPDDYRWKYYTEHSHAIKQNIRLSFKVLRFQSSAEDVNSAISFMKSHFDSNKSFVDYKFEEIPTDFIPAHLKRFVISKVAVKDSKKKVKVVGADAYEFMLYLQVVKNIDNGTVTVRDSLSYKSFDDELLPNEYWHSDKENIMKDASSQLLSLSIVDILHVLEAQLNKRYIEVNSRISSGANDKIKFQFDKKGTIAKWNIPYKKLDDSINNPFYDDMNVASLSQIIRFANEHTGFMKQFTHILKAYNTNAVNESSLAACIVAKGTGIDIYRMKDISDIKEQDLIFNYNNFIRYKTLTSASDVVINKVAKLPTFEKYNLADYGVHASVDGQKIETRYNTIKARYSSKYYGFGKGVSAYTLFANCLPLCTKIIGANEHESHYLLDALKSNSSDIEIAAVSGDMHSINRVNFALLHMFGYRFMPRFTQLDQKASNNLVSFDNINNHKKNIIKPSKQVNKNLILKESDNILRILATLALKKNTQSNIVRKLSSYKSNDTMKALIELDKIIMSLYMLDYIDDEDMRKCVHRSLNRGESYHFLISSILKVSGRKLVGKTELELIINNECARLIAICIIFYNAYLLSSLYEHCRSKNMQEQCKQIIRLSPVAWQHISLVGKYEFLSNMELPNIESLIEQLVGNLGSMVVVAHKKVRKK